MLFYYRWVLITLLLILGIVIGLWDASWLSRLSRSDFFPIYLMPWILVLVLVASICRVAYRLLAWSGQGSRKKSVSWVLPPEAAEQLKGPGRISPAPFYHRYLRYIYILLLLLLVAEVITNGKGVVLSLVDRRNPYHPDQLFSPPRAAEWVALLLLGGVVVVMRIARQQLRTSLRTEGLPVVLTHEGLSTPVLVLDWGKWGGLTLDSYRLTPIKGSNSHELALYVEDNLTLSQNPDHEVLLELPNEKVAEVDALLRDIAHS